MNQESRIKNIIKKILNSQFKKGYIALGTVLVMAAVVITITITVSLPSISEGQLSLAEKKKEESLDFVESCLEEALLVLNETSSIPGKIVLPEGSCDVVINSHIDDNWIFTVSGSVDGYYHSIQVEANRGGRVTITGWRII